MVSEVTAEEGARVNFRIPEPQAAKVREVGEMLGYTNLSAAARHLMVMGLDAQIHKLIMKRSTEASERNMMASQETLATVAPAAFMETVKAFTDALKQSNAEPVGGLPILDTTATSRDRENGVARLK
jgi:hypothetical protein